MKMRILGALVAALTIGTAPALWAATADGSGSLEINYSGPFDKITPQNATLNGMLRIANGNILMRASQSNLTNCNATLRFRNADIIIDSLRFLVTDKRIILNAFVVMSNHIHLIWQQNKMNGK